MRAALLTEVGKPLEIVHDIDIRPPRIGEVLLRTTETGNVLSTQEHEQGAELTFNPPVAGVGLMEFSACDRLLEVGYKHAIERLEGWVSNIV